jgi:dCMP deaminase
MPNINKDFMYMRIANEISGMSYAKRKKVGAIIVKDNSIISYGYNGTPHDFDNSCEDENDVTKPEVLHAESNAISKIARSTQSSEAADLYVTMSPCLECSKLIIQSGIKKVFFEEAYRNTEGLELLRKSNIKVTQL